MNKIQLLNDTRTLANVQDIYKDIAAGDPEALKIFDGLNLDMDAIRTAINFIVSNEKLSEEEKSGLLKESWRINFRANPPTPEEFLTEKYLGPTAKTLYPRVRKVFTDFLDPNSVARNLVLYCHIGFGKSFCSSMALLYIATCVSLMRDPYKYFGLSPATLLCIMLISYSLRKSREVLLKPFNNMMEASPYFIRVPRQDAMKQLKEEFKNKDTVENLYYTTADPDSDFVFDSGLCIKTNSSVAGLLGVSAIAICLSEISFYTDAGKALYSKELVITKTGIKQINDVKVHDSVLSPNGKFTEVIAIPWEGEDDLFEITVEDGRTVKCNLDHLWKVTFCDKDGLIQNTIVSTRFMIEHPEYEFDIYEYSTEQL